MSDTRIVPAGWTRGRAIEVKRAPWPSSTIVVNLPHLAQTDGREVLQHEFIDLGEFVEWVAWWFEPKAGAW